MPKGGQAGMCSRSPTMVLVCQGMLAPLTLPPSPPRCLCRLGSSPSPWERATREKDPQRQWSCLRWLSRTQESDWAGLSPSCKTHPGRSFALGRQLGGCCPISLRSEALPLPVPQFPHPAMLLAGDAAPYLHLPAASLGSRCHTCGPRPPLPSVPLWPRAA